MNWFLFALICLMFVIIVLIFVSIHIYARNRKLLKEWGVANGHITDIKLSSEWGYNAAMGDSDYMQKRKTIVEYEVEGRVYTFIPTTFRTSDKVGDDFSILYDKNNPSKARGYKGTRLGFRILLLVVLGLIILWIVYFSIFWCGGVL